MSRKLFKKADIIVIAAALALCAVLMLPSFFDSSEVWAVIYYGGGEYERIPLGRGEDRSITVGDGLEAVIKVEDDCVYFQSAQCPDKLCVNQGKLSRRGETAACLPAGVVLRLEGRGGFDAITGRIAGDEG